MHGQFFGRTVPRLMNLILLNDNGCLLQSSNVEILRHHFCNTHELTWYEGILFICSEFRLEKVLMRCRCKYTEFIQGIGLVQNHSLILCNKVDFIDQVNQAMINKSVL